MIDPNYRSQPTRARRVTRVSRAAARCLKTQLPKYIQNEGHYHRLEPGVRAASTAADADCGEQSWESPVRAESSVHRLWGPRAHPNAAPSAQACQELPAMPICLKLFHYVSAV